MITATIQIDADLVRANCYEAAFDVLTQLNEYPILMARACHGRPIWWGDFDTEGVDPDGHYSHAWVEVSGLIMDFSHGHEFVLPVDRYYSLGKIDPSKVKKRSYDELCYMTYTYGHWGPWEEDQAEVPVALG